MARIPEGQRMVGSHVSAVNAEAMPRKRHRVSGFNVKEGDYRPVKRPSSDNLRAYRQVTNGSAVNIPRLFVLGRNGFGIGV